MTATRDTWTKAELYNILNSLWIVTDHMPDDVKVVTKATLAAVGRALGLFGDVADQPIPAGTLFTRKGPAETIQHDERP